MQQQQLLYLIIILLAFNIIAAAGPLEVVFLIASQDGSGYHRQLCAKLSQDIMDQSRLLDGHYRTDYVINIKILHEIFNGPGDWSPLNVLTAHTRSFRGSAAAVDVSPLQNSSSEFSLLLSENTAWVIWCEDTTQLNLRLLLDHLAQEDHTVAFYSGFALHDREATIIHHFAFYKDPKWFPYPLLRSGIIFTPALLRRLSALVASESVGRSSQMPEFTIDAAHELARAILRIPAGSSDDKKVPSPAASVVPNEIPQDRSNNNKIPAAMSYQQGRARTKGQGRNATIARNMLLRKSTYICGPATVASTSLQQLNNNGEGHVVMGQRDANKDTLAANENDKESEGRQKTTVACAMQAKPMNSARCMPVQRDEIYFAIKTCQKFHKERIPVLQATWTPFTIHRTYFSDVADASVPTVAVGVPNTETGHCAKTLAILKLALKDIDDYNNNKKMYNSHARRPNASVHQQKDNHRNRSNNKRLLNQLPHVADTASEQRATAYEYKSHRRIRWLFLSDDDTLLSVAALSEFLGCFDPQTDVYLGERYGYRLHAADGFNYITGGGGIALTLSTARKIVAHCTCPTAAAPDDMLLGACLQALRVHATHSTRFHQARPADYAHDLLRLEAPISFHKFWQSDPRQVYARWFAANDQRLLVPSSTTSVDNDDYSNSAELQFIHNHSRRQISDTEALACKAHTNERHVDL